MGPTTDIHIVTRHDRAAVLLHPLRLQLLERLAAPDSAAGLARRMGLPRQKLNYHLRQLEAEGLVEQVGERRRGNCTERLVRAVARSYVISPAALGQLATGPSAVRDRASSAYLVAVAARTLGEVAALRAGAERAGKALPTLTIDTEVRFASPADQHRFAEEYARLVGTLVAKYHDAEAPRGRRFRVSGAAYPFPAANDAGPGDEEDR